jgi:ribosomal protein S18 acetylase RimI-like enzyme
MLAGSSSATMPTPQDLTIERAEVDDFDWCARLMAGSEPWITLRRSLEECRVALCRPGSELYVARERGRRVGFILIHPYGCVGSPYIQSVAVAEGARGRGIGTQLVAFAERQMASRRFIFLCVSSFNRRAQELYSRLGYQRVGEIPDYVVEGHSELLLCKKLP